ncbi:MAG: tyrosine-type recombinase/integrase [Oligoflexales bacterium]|nr:tyrosine-type recombinase/integrase [Oligoflexales bacterium]
MEFKDQPNILKRRIIWINSILSWLGRPKIENIQKQKRAVVTYLNETEFKQLCLTIDNREIRNICVIAFYTGLRLGEIFGLNQKSIKEDRLQIDSQMYDKRRNYKIDTTKTDSERDVIFPDMARDIVQWFIDLPLSEKKRLRDIQYCKLVKKKCNKIWPSDPEKNCNFHSLRHSNAIWLLQKKATLHEVAQHLGNLIEVTERYYSGFVLRKESVERLNGLINGA